MPTCGFVRKGLRLVGSAFVLCFGDAVGLHAIGDDRIFLFVVGQMNSIGYDQYIVGRLNDCWYGAGSIPDLPDDTPCCLVKEEALPVTLDTDRSEEHTSELQS